MRKCKIRPAAAILAAVCLISGCDGAEQSSVSYDSEIYQSIADSLFAGNSDTPDNTSDSTSDNTPENSITQSENNDNDNNNNDTDYDNNNTNSENTSDIGNPQTPDITTESEDLPEEIPPVSDNNTEQPPESTPEQSDITQVQSPEITPEQQPETQPEQSETQPEQSETEPPVETQPPKPVTYEVGNHLWSTDNSIYNSNITYIDRDRYNSQLTIYNRRELLWQGNAKKDFKYNRKAAIEYASKNYNTGSELCAEFVSDCLVKGGLDIQSDSSTALALKLLYSGYGYGQFITLNQDNTVTLPEYAKPGDVIMLYCPYEGFMIHSTIYCGNDENGKAKVYSHNPTKNGKQAYEVYIDCIYCHANVYQVFYYHFYEPEETGVSATEPDFSDDTMVFTNQCLYLKQQYDSAAAVQYALDNPKDCVGTLGATHLSDCLKAGGITVYYPHNSALLFQLVTSGLGTAHTLSINEDKTITAPDNVSAGDICFIYCDHDGLMISAFLISGIDENGNIIAASFDNVNDGSSAYIADKFCIGCAGKLSGALIYSFNK